jgi:SepF-like predicted cell division protein (DUF552 family)
MGLKEKLGKILPSKSEEGEDFVEVGPAPEENGISVRIDTLKDYADTDRVQQSLREGSVIFLRIRDLREKDINELKRAVEKLRKTITAMNGDVVGVDEDFLILTPQFAKIYRGKAV